MSDEDVEHAKRVLARAGYRVVAPVYPGPEDLAKWAAEVVYYSRTIADLDEAVRSRALWNGEVLESTPEQRRKALHEAIRQGRDWH